MKFAPILCVAASLFVSRVGASGSNPNTNNDGGNDGGNKNDGSGNNNKNGKGGKKRGGDNKKNNAVSVAAGSLALLGIIATLAC